MEESSEKPLNLNKSKYFTVIDSSYSLRKIKTLARSESEPSTSSIETSSASEDSTSSNFSKSQDIETPSSVSDSPYSTSNDSSEETPNEQEFEPQRRVDEILKGFRETYDELVEEEKLSETGEKLRLDLDAYNLFREKNKHLRDATKAFGSIPEVKVGDEFRFMVELFLTGLHIPQESIDVMKRDGRVVAVSIVSVTNNVSKLKSSEDLVCCGDGQKKRNQRMEGGNLALKHSINGQTPVRVILGFERGENKEMTYVYIGLYSVEKYWTVKDEHSCEVFMFQMRRWPNQTKLDIDEVKKKFRLRLHSDDNERDLSPLECTPERAGPSDFETCVEGASVEVTNPLSKREREEEEEECEAQRLKKVEQTLSDLHDIYQKLLEEDEAKQEANKLRRLQRKFDIKDAKKTISLSAFYAQKRPQDVSQGKEKVPIRVVNTIDNEHILPFEYITELIRPLNYVPIPLEGCNCVNGCSDSDTCTCAVRNGGELPFNNKGAIVEAKPLVYECGPLCKCPPSCYNRVSQHGIKFPLEIFKTETMGWGVRSRMFIPSGSFICEYIAELLDDEEAQDRTTDEYLFAIGNNYYDESLWEGLSSVPCLKKSASSEAEEDGGFTLDGSKYGNVGRFINHSCTPNLYAQNLLYDHDDKRMPCVTFFACEDITPMQELTYHYNYTIDEVYDSEGNIRKKICYCGSVECTGRLY